MANLLTKRITNLATGVTADDEMTRDTLDIKENGEVARDKFIEPITSIDNKQSYYSSIKKQNIKLFEKKQSIAVDEYQSFTKVFDPYDQKKLDLRKLMEWPVTSKPWAIVNEDMKSRNNQKSLFRNELQLMSTNPPSAEAPEDIETSIVDGMRVVRLITVSKLTQNTFRWWAGAFVGYLRVLPGRLLHLIFDDYNYKYHISTKVRDANGMVREINDLDQEVPTAKEWENFLINDINKLRLVNLLVKYIASVECTIEKQVFVNNGPKRYSK